MQNIPWNFAKFIVDRDGNVKHFMKPNIDPVDAVPYIKSLLS